MSRRSVVLTTMLALTLSVDAAELVTLVRLSDAALRVRFALPATCDPVLSATRPTPHGTIDVTIVCLGNTADAPGSPAAHPTDPPGRARR